MRLRSNVVSAGLCSDVPDAIFRSATISSITVCPVITAVTVHRSLRYVLNVARTHCGCSGTVLRR